MQETRVIGSRTVSSLWFYYTDGKEFVAEASELGSSFDPFSQIWNDSCNDGFVMIGQKTGMELIFTYAHTHRDAGGEITHWSFTAHPNLNKGKIKDRIFATILND